MKGNIEAGNIVSVKMVVKIIGTANSHILQQCYHSCARVLSYLSLQAERRELAYSIYKDCFGEDDRLSISLLSPSFRESKD